MVADISANTPNAIDKTTMSTNWELFDLELLSELDSTGVTVVVKSVAKVVIELTTEVTLLTSA